jgi:DNA-binding transcriptional LysR family regulator
LAQDAIRLRQILQRQATFLRSPGDSTGFSSDLFLAPMAEDVHLEPTIRSRPFTARVPSSELSKKEALPRYERQRLLRRWIVLGGEDVVRPSSRTCCVTQLPCFATAAAPDYWRMCGKPHYPGELLHHACIRHIRIDLVGPLVATTFDLELRAAISGLGVISSFEDYLAPALDSGALEPALDEWRDSFPGPFLYYSSRRHMPGPLRAFVDFLGLLQPSPSGSVTG